MISFLTLYKFKTPFFDIQYEKQSLLNIEKNIKYFFDFQGISYSKINTDTSDYFNTIFISEEGVEVIISFIKNDTNIYMPLIIVDLKVLDNIISSNYFYNFLELFLECFDGVKENTYIADFINGDKIDNHFLLLSKLYKKYSDENKIVNSLTMILNNGINTKNDFLNIEEIFLYFNYLVYEMYLNIYRIQEVKNTSKNIKHGGLELQKERINHLENINIVVFKKYVKMLEQFYNIFN